MINRKKPNNNMTINSNSDARNHAPGSVKTILQVQVNEPTLSKQTIAIQSIGKLHIEKPSERSPIITKNINKMKRFKVFNQSASKNVEAYLSKKGRSHICVRDNFEDKYLLSLNQL
ncbi:hypothetical protein AKO1_001833 [Acrasis kona]|uniref:Uncharacterized protein n=1 Tax=Acrasis kona TaxID=1008807 RepID=A0AAW2Z8L9_9EUKA